VFPVAFLGEMFSKVGLPSVFLLFHHQTVLNVDGPDDMLVSLVDGRTMKQLRCQYFHWTNEEITYFNDGLSLLVFASVQMVENLCWAVSCLMTALMRSLYVRASFKSLSLSRCAL
jgi:hypothetical protein